MVMGIIVLIGLRVRDRECLHFVVIACWRCSRSSGMSAETMRADRYFRSNS